jgi:hypothetical protein
MVMVKQHKPPAERMHQQAPLKAAPEHSLRLHDDVIVVWLRNLGLGKYEAASHENEIDETAPPQH